MPMEPPPSRYRVIERGGRLVVIDSAVGGAPLTARELLPDVVADDSAAMSLQSYPRMGTEDDAAVAPPRPAAAPATVAAPLGLLRNVAATVCGDRRDRAGALRWKTARWFDAKGPRDVVLSEEAERQLGLAVLVLVGAALVVVGLVVMGDMLGWMIAFAGAFLAARARPLATAWLDRLTVS